MSSMIKVSIPEDLITLAEASAYSGLTIHTIRYHLNNGNIEGYFTPDSRLKKVSRSALDQLLENSRVGRPAGWVENSENARRDVKETRTNRLNGKKYELIYDPNTSKKWWLHCQKHGVMLAVETRRESTRLLAQPTEWCEYCAQEDL